MTYSLIPIVALIVAAILNWDLFIDKNYPVLKQDIFKSYRLVIISYAVFFTADILWGVFDSLPNKIPGIIDTSIFFAVMAISVATWLSFTSKYLEESKRVTTALLCMGALFFLAGIVLVIVNLFEPILFSYASGTYDAKVGRYGYFLSQMVMYILTSIFALIRFLKTEGDRKRRHFTIVLVGIAMAGAIFLQIFYPELPLYSFGLLVCLVLVHIFITNAEKEDLARSISESTHREQVQSEELEATRTLAYHDPLTGIKNKHAYVELEEKINLQISKKEIEEFCVFIFDLNDLKVINDTYGHERGDQYIIKSVQIIQKVLEQTNVYRLGGDEFVSILQGEEYKNRYKLLDKFNKIVESNIGKNEPIIAVGFSDFVPAQDNTIRTVFARADERMYTRKSKLKEMTKDQNGVNDNSSPELITRFDIYETFYKHDKRSLINLLNSLSSDEIMEVDLVNDTFKQYYHVEGKYFVPHVEFSYKDLVDFTVAHIVHPDDVGPYLSLMKMDGFFERLATAKIPNFDMGHFRYKLQDGKYRYVEQCVITGEENGIPPGMFRMYVFDVHNLLTSKSGVVADESGVISVGRDQITGLLTSKEFFKKAESIIKEEKNKKWCLIFVDIEHFKFFDEWFGREKGDYLLANIGAELSENKELMSGVAGYFGQDDFVALVEYDKEKITALYNRIKEHIDSFGLTTGFLPAIGVAKLEKDMLLVDAFDRASIAATKVKGDIHNRICYYNSDMQFSAQHEYRILTEFMHALKNDEITFYLQPQCRAKTGKIVGVEALARWIKKDGTVVYPNDFIPVLEKYNFITDMDQFLWDKICRSLKKWLDSGRDAVPVSINVSRLDIYNFDIAKFIHDLAEKYSLPHNLVKIEITESAYVETSDAVSVLVKELREDGFSVLMDDFGSGYSSLNMLSNIKVDAIKLDSDFLHLEGQDYEKGIRIIESVVNMAKMMALPIIVEGVETKQQCDFLMELGCRYVQGYYFYRPIPVEEFEKIMRQENIVDKRGFIAKTNEQFRIREFLDENIYSDTMLNNILGAVAFYAWHDKHVDIVRFNQQFYEAVSAPDFSSRLEKIEQFVPEEDRPNLFNALQEAKDNRLVGSTATLRFARSDGTYACFRIHFYYLGEKEGEDTFYGSAINDSEVVSLREIKELMSEYSTDSMIFISCLNKKLVFNVVSHGLSDIYGVTPKQLEDQLNNEAFYHHSYGGESQIKELDSELFKNAKKKKDFEKIITVIDKNNEKIKVRLKFNYVADKTYNIDYIMNCEIVEK